jgi:(1->4)-alpha-D-glucan 1-alpha-D-glucosylmutase
MRHKREADGELLPDRATEYLLYQTLVGAWLCDLPSGDLAAFRDRIQQYMEKATREAKLHTSWINPDEAYDAALANFVAAILNPDEKGPFLDDLAGVARRVAFFGRINSLAQTLLKLTSPGVPDTYQGTELWDLSLVDPDNRRPVDYELRRRALSALDERATDDAGRARLAAELLAQAEDGRIKLYLVATALRHRRAHRELYRRGDYLPLEATGKRSAHLCAYARARGDEALIVVAPRLVVGLTEGAERMPLGAEVWDDTALALPAPLAEGRYRDLLTGQVHTVGDTTPLGELLAVLPIALLERVGRSS